MPLGWLLRLFLVCTVDALTASSSFPSDPSFILRVDDAQPLTPPVGTPPSAFPPLVSVPCDMTLPTKDNNNDNSNESNNPCHHRLTEIVQPPNVDALYEWYTTHAIPPQADADPSWATVWPTAVGLCNYLLKYSCQTIQNQRLVELGAGLGIPGLVAATLGASSVTLTDREPWALQCAMATAAANGLLSSETSLPQSPPLVQAALLDWNKDVPPNLCGQADVILATDVLYDIEVVPSLARTIQRLVADDTNDRKPSRLLLADPHSERAVGARDALSEALSTSPSGSTRTLSSVTTTTTLLPIPPLAQNEATTMDGRDYQRRLANEPIVLFECVW